MNQKPNKAPDQRPWLSRLVLRAARAAPATVVAHLERSAKKAPVAKASLILRVIYAVCLVGATCVHLDLHFRSGVLLGDLAAFGYPLFSRLYWSALTLLDPLAAVMLFVLPRAGLLLAAAIIVSNVTHNSWVLYWMNQ